MATTSSYLDDYHIGTHKKRGVEKKYFSEVRKIYKRDYTLLLLIKQEFKEYYNDVQYI